MRRVALALAVVGVLAFGAAQAQARPPHADRSPHHSQRGRHHSYRGPHHGYGYHHGPSRYHWPRAVVPPPVVRHHYYGPRWAVPVPVYPRPYYYAPRSGFYYRGSGISIGIGF